MPLLRLRRPRESQPAADGLAPSDLGRTHFQNLWAGAPGALQDVIRGDHAFTAVNFVSQVVGPFGRAIQGNGSGNVGVVTGYETAAGAVPLTGADAMSAFILVEFTSLSADGIQYPLIRKDQDGSAGSNYQFSLEYKITAGPVMNLVPLLATSGTTGWVGGTGVAMSVTPQVGVLYLAGVRWKSGTWELIFQPIGTGKAAAQASPVSPTGTVTVGGGSETNFQTHFLGMAYTTGYSSTAKAYGGGASRQFLPDPVLQAIIDNPSRLFEDEVRTVLIPSSGSSFTFDGSGGISFAGAATTAASANFAISGAGGLTFAGAATVAYTANFSATAAGGLTFGGAATATYTAAYAATGTGGLQFGGAATASFDTGYAYTGTGGLQFSGSAATTYTVDFAAVGSGGLNFGGSASAAFSADFSVAGSGGLAFGGAAASAYTANYAAVGAGGITFGGSATASFDTGFSVTGSGGLVLGGAAVAQIGSANFLATGTGGLNLGGAAAVEFTVNGAILTPAPSAGGGGARRRIEAMRERDRMVKRNNQIIQATIAMVLSGLLDEIEG